MREASAKIFALITTLISCPRESSANPKAFLQQTPVRIGSGPRGLWVSEVAMRVLERNLLMASVQVFGIIGC